METKKPERIRCCHPGGGTLMTKQSMKKETDVNAIMARYMETGTLTHVSERKRTYGDFTHAEDYLASLNRVMDANDQFQALPAHIRKHVHNNPAAFLEMVYDPERSKELIELGLLPEQNPAESSKEPAKTPPGSDEKDEKKD